MRSHYTTRKCRYWCVPHVFTYKVELGEAQDSGPPKGTPSWMVDQSKLTEEEAAAFGTFCSCYVSCYDLIIDILHHSVRAL